ncbi:MAG: hypothetical protein HY815_09190, partial [Candidatus Riflebacteria bacterium]|nr:hypothetical protein [Candidatus Riflebacteria bacterium]
MTHRGTARPAALLVVAVALLAPSIAPTGSRSSDPASGKLRRLLLAYPDFLDHESGANAVVFNDGTRMTFDDGRPKNGPEALMNDADLEDQMRMDYPPGRSWREPAIDHDPGRARYEPFFKKMYGATEREVRSHLVAVEWL